ncbi:hypothetical protein Fmac_029288 [Flemingia macrophylla]|uniref:Uncharacterized protein n=1 Tax=Flemingia macrophylla TaxID=520843 RepID=A0ABD1L9W5_9FABA
MEGDEELLAQTEVKVEPKKDEWMTTLPPERKDEYIKAYYAASLKQQQELEEAAKTQLSNTPPADDPSSSTSNRQSWHEIKTGYSNLKDRKLTTMTTRKMTMSSKETLA